jgi:ATP adenylyltransferase
VTKRLWAPWRMAYIGSARAAAGCVFCEALSRTDDRASLVLTRGDRAYLILNAYPYTSGHLMAVINRHVGDVTQATAEEWAAVMGLAATAAGALSAEYGADGFNIGINQGRVAGAGIEGHLHVHVVPRWHGDSNFMGVVGDVRVLPEALEQTWKRLKARLHG